MFMLIIGLVLLCIHYCNRPSETIIKTEIQRDTITKTDTITKYLPSAVRTAYIHDTIILVDSVEKQIPIVQAEYKDSTYEAVVSGGYFAQIEQISVYPKTVYVNTYETKYIKQKPKITLVAGVGVGYNPKYNRVVPTIGLAVGVNLWSYYGKNKN